MDAIIREIKNPVITAKDIPFECMRCFNPAAAKFNGKYILLIRAMDFKKQESFALAESDNGVDFKVRKDFKLTPAPTDEGRMNDPRITKIGDTYYIVYCSDPKSGIKIGIMKTKDFVNFERIYYSEPDNRNAVLFSEKIGGFYYRLDRPFTRWYYLDRGYDIWVSKSPDLEYWGGHSLLLKYSDVAWGNNKIGPGPQPVKTDKGWLVIYHGAEFPDGTDTAWRKTYRAGVMLLDLKDPSKILARPAAPLLSPEAPYETDPTYRPNAIFPTGLIEEDDGGLKLYYGAADNSIALAHTTKQKLLDFCFNPPEYKHPRNHPENAVYLSRHA